MGVISDTADQVYRDYENAGLPVPGTEHEPVKREIRDLFEVVDTAFSNVQAAQKSGYILVGSWSDLDALDTEGLIIGAGARVVGDEGTHTDPVTSETVDNEGVYTLSDDPAGWQRLGDLEDAAAEAAAAAAQGYASDAAAAVASLEGVPEITQALLETNYFGKQAVPGSGAGLFTSATTFVLNDPQEDDHVVRTVEVECQGAATLKLNVFSKDGDDFTATGDPVDVVVAAGVNTLSGLDIAVPAGQMFGFYTPANIVKRTVTTADGGGYYSATGEFIDNADEFTDATATTTTQIQMRVTAERQVVTAERALDQETRLLQIEGAFTKSENKNLFNPALALDNYRATGNNGANTYLPSAGRISLGFQPVEPGKTYVWSINHDIGFENNKRLICRNAAHNWIGDTSGSSTIPENPPELEVIDDRTLRFSVPAETLVRYVGISTRVLADHTTEDFDAIVASVQLEEGEEKTTLEPPSPNGMARLNALNAPDGGADAVSPETLEGTLGYVALSGDNLYIRTHWDETRDVVQRIALQGGTSTSSPVVNFGGVKLVAKDVRNIQDAYNNATETLAVQGDDVGPYNYGNTFLGGNHGLDDMVTSTAAGHGKTIEDVGSVWVDSAGHNYVIMDVPSANGIDFVSENRAVYPDWLFWGHPTIGTLTHVSGATHTGDIVITANTVKQMMPAINSRTRRVFVDGVEMSENGKRPFTGSVRILEAYNVNNPASMVEIAMANAGSATLPDYEGEGVASDLSVTLAYEFAPNGVTTLVSGGAALNPLDAFGYVGLTQAVSLIYGNPLSDGDKLWQYVPRVAPFTIGANDYDLAAQHDISAGLADSLELTADRWADPNNPPGEMAQIVRTAGGALKYGFMIGYNRDRARGKPEERRDSVLSAGLVNLEEKQYLRYIQAGSTDFGDTLAANQHFTGVVFRAFIPPTVPEATTFFWYQLGSEIFVRADFHQSVSGLKLPLPERFVGRKITVIDKSDDLTLHTEDTVTEAGLSVSVTDYGYLDVKLT